MPQTPVIPAENEKKQPASPPKPAFSALPYYKAALAIVFQNPRLAAWKIASDVFSRLAYGLIALVLIASFGTAIVTVPDAFQSAAFITGVTGTAFVLWLFGMFFNAFAHSGIYATLNHILKKSPANTPSSEAPQSDNSPNPTPSFFSNALERLDAAFGLQVISWTGRFILALLAVTLAITLFSSFPLHAAALNGSAATATIWAFGLALYMVLALLVRLTIELIAAPLFLDERSLSDSILHAADFVLQYPIQLYRLFVSMLSITLIPMGVYFLLLMTQNAILMFAPPLAPVGLAIRLFADLFLFISLAVVAVIFYTAVFAFYGEQRAIWTTSDLDDFMHNPENSTPVFLRELFSPTKKAINATQSDFSESATLTTLTPSENPNIITFDQVFEPEVLSHFAPQPGEDEQHEDDNTDSLDDDPTPDPSSH